MSNYKPIAPPTNFGRFFEFTASQLRTGDIQEHHWCWHPKMPHMKGTWAHRENAQRFAFPRFDGGDWFHYAPCSVPLHCAGRIKQPVNVMQDTSSFRDNLVVEVEFDYGSGHMLNKRWVLPWQVLVEAVRFFDDEKEYDRLLTLCDAEFDDAEFKIQQAVKDDQKEMQEALNESAAAWWAENEKGPEGAVLRLSTRTLVSEVGIFYEALDTERLVFHGMGTFLEKVQPGEVVITESARKLLHSVGETGGLSGISFHPKSLSWFGYRAIGFVDAREGIYVQNEAHSVIDTFPTWDCPDDGSVLPS